jgi:hypothetical protein
MFNTGSGKAVALSLDAIEDATRKMNVVTLSPAGAAALSKDLSNNASQLAIDEGLSSKRRIDDKGPQEPEEVSKATKVHDLRFRPASQLISKVS